MKNRCRWRSLDVGDDFLLGAEEGGFAGIEVLEEGDYTDDFQDDGDNSNVREESELEAEDTERKDDDVGRFASTTEKAASSSHGRQEKRREARRLRRLEARRASSRRKKNSNGEGLDEEARGKKRSRTQDDAVAAAAAAAADEVEIEVEDDGKEDLDTYLLREMEDEERRERSMRSASCMHAVDTTTIEAVDLPHNSPWREFGLHASLLKALAVLRFFAPTPIQSMTLHDVLGSSSSPSSSLPSSATHADRRQIPIRDVVGAAVTGSGKTLAFTLPVLQGLLMEVDETNASAVVAQRLRCLMLAPTRELAMQIAETVRAMLVFTGDNEAQPHHARASSPALAVGILVGGMSAVKQERVLAKLKPAIVVATPGRLWDIITKSSAGVSGTVKESRDQHHHLHDLSGLRYLVIDEADRMLKKGQFAELGNVLDIIRNGKTTGENGDDTNRIVVPPAVLPQAFIFSATMNVHDDIKLYFKNQNKKTKARAAKAGSLDALLRRLRFRRNPVIIDANTRSNVSVGFDTKEGGEVSDDDGDDDDKGTKGYDKDIDDSVATEEGTNGGSGGGVVGAQASGLSSNVIETMVQVPEVDRDAALYYILNTLGGTSIVFCNAITTVKRVASLLKLLNVECVQLHANMIMKARLKALDKFKAHCVRGTGSAAQESLGPDCVLIATDVASRGIDISGVNTVIHYHLPHNAELYVHRAGRAGRGRFDETAASTSIGKSLVIVTPQSYRDYTLLCKNMGLERLHDSLTVDPRLLKTCAQRVHAAQKLERLAHEHQLSAKNASWMRRNADEAEIAIGLGSGNAGAAPVSVAAYGIDDDDENEDALIVDGDEKVIRRHSRGKSDRTSGAVDAMRRELDAMLALPLTGPARRSKFPLAASSLQIAAVPNRRFAKRPHRE